MGMPRRVPNYAYLPHLATTLNDISSISAFVLGASTFIFMYNIYWTHKKRPDRHRRRPVGLRELAGVGDVLPAAAAQLHLDPADQVRAPGVRPALPAHQGGARP